MIRFRRIALAIAIAAASGGAQAQDDEVTPPAPQVFQALVACRAIADDAQRLACYDQQVAAVAAAEQSRDIVVYDRTDVREAQRGLFGLRLPRIRLFGSDDEQVDRIESTLTAVSGGQSSRPWVLRLADGSLWRQIDSEQLSRDPRAGHPIVIERAALGSFRAEIDGMRPIRVTRVE